MHERLRSAGGLRVEVARLMPVAVFTAVYIVTASWFALQRGNSEFMLYIGVMLLLIPAVVWVHSRVLLNDAVLWGLSIWGFVHMAGGLVPVPEAWPIEGNTRVLYSWWIVPDRLKYDHVVHAYGFGLATWVCWQGMRAAIWRHGNGAVPSFGLMVLAASAGMGLGSLNELVEFAATLLVPETNVGGYLNTGWDLVANMCGAVTAATLIWMYDRADPRLATQTEPKR